MREPGPQHWAIVPGARSWWQGKLLYFLTVNDLRHLLARLFFAIIEPSSAVVDSSRFVGAVGRGLLGNLLIFAISITEKQRGRVHFRGSFHIRPTIEELRRIGEEGVPRDRTRQLLSEQESWAPVILRPQILAVSFDWT